MATTSTRKTKNNQNMKLKKINYLVANMTKNTRIAGKFDSLKAQQEAIENKTRTK